MDRSSLISIALVLISLAVGLVVFGVLRERGTRVVGAGCAAIAAGIGIIALFVLYEIVTILA